jgi:tRNA(Met) C34 N-acetyltransferase TmcA
LLGKIFLPNISDDKSRQKLLLKKLSKKKNKNKNEKEEEIDKALEDPLHLFVSATEIRFCYFKETQNILGTTYGMLVLQDFEAITPNILARVIETVEGGGIICLLLPKLNSLKQIYTMAMDVHCKIYIIFKQGLEPIHNMILLQGLMKDFYYL